MFFSSGTSMSNWDIAPHYQSGDTRDLLVRNARLGEALASCFCSSTNAGNSPDQCVVLMRGHGLTVIAPKIEDCVFRAIYTQENAHIHTTSLLLNAAYHGGAATKSSVHYLSEEEIVATTSGKLKSSPRAWELWAREVEAEGLYVNQG